MKNILIVVLSFLSLILNGQNNMNEELNKLFLDLDLASSPKNMVNKSPLKFEHIVRQGISWGNAGGNVSDFVARFDKNPLIESSIKEGQISIIQKDEDIQSGNFSITERVWFYNKEDMINEYHKLIESFEKLGSRVKNSTIQNEDFDTKYENTEILMETDSKKSTLTIGYHLPPREEEDKLYFLAFVYTNHN
ncbi:hypothetical protein LF887_08635 [Chryseobacterium sp. MEBOG06]|uniref:hypothetical protein n=1 Tax=Chryseobacterium sp. MEBOG06 TaxID=2879938 RepID=UPI001F16ED5D|nr:hypothetical protein [Chryseobacterium sp. MEBOG06]UKB85673.1 hypothetical protein LF887_08635 [Chryseobacterium sp. MEBOG06]